jgi:hypothetical protein
MSRRGKGRSFQPEPLTGPMPPLEIVELQPASGWRPGQPPPTQEALKRGKQKIRLLAFALDLIDRLASNDPRMVQAARAALKEIAREDHGPEPDATADDRESARAGWVKWFEGQR